ncbi:hypothetical protein EVAR_82339_1 [Eumeta japonica]|uniref:Uncharacterized protein n=1 Tax=Eumeta variegata TaxID=151549 RepID=A0A4C1U9T8_EUMVA|nr:hypothetical protein EVAR_82339_1 [Eumeta japonica]
MIMELDVLDFDSGNVPIFNPNPALDSDGFPTFDNEPRPVLNSDHGFDFDFDPDPTVDFDPGSIDDTKPTCR